MCIPVLVPGILYLHVAALLGHCRQIFGALASELQAPNSAAKPLAVSRFSSNLLHTDAHAHTRMYARTHTYTQVLPEIGQLAHPAGGETTDW